MTDNFKPDRTITPNATVKWFFFNNELNISFTLPDKYREQIDYILENNKGMLINITPNDLSLIFTNKKLENKDYHIEFDMDKVD